MLATKQAARFLEQDMLLQLHRPFGNGHEQAQRHHRSPARYRRAEETTDAISMDANRRVGDLLCAGTSFIRICFAQLYSRCRSCDDRRDRNSDKIRYRQWIPVLSAQLW